MMALLLPDNLLHGGACTSGGPARAVSWAAATRPTAAVRVAVLGAVRVTAAVIAAEAVRVAPEPMMGAAVAVAEACPVKLAVPVPVWLAAAVRELVPLSPAVVRARQVLARQHSPRSARSRSPLGDSINRASLRRQILMLQWPPLVPTWNLVSANTMIRSRTITGMAHAG